MFSTFKQRLLLGIYIFIILSIPVGAFLASQYQNIKSSAHEQKTKTVAKSTPKPTTSPAKKLLQNLDDTDSSSSSTSDKTSSPTIATSFGPTLSLKASLEGRPKDNQTAKLFVGIVEGLLSVNPKFLLSFTLDLPESGEYSNLSLAGLTSGTKYTALLKGPAQIATSSAFIMSPNVTNLNEGQALDLLTGDLNEDNVINSTDYSIVQKAMGANSSSSNWNDAADFNLDGVINIFDLAIIQKNLGKVGESGAWTSPIPQASASARLAPAERASLNSSSTGSAQGGYWIWIPK